MAGGAMTPIPTLTIASLYPNAAMPTFGLFVERRIQQLVAAGVITTRVLAPVPWFPLRHPHLGRWSRWARVPQVECRGGITIEHPRYPHIPRWGTALQPHTMAAVLAHRARALHRRGFRFRLVDAHYAYPDGVAALALARAFRVPLVVTARGTDLNLLARFPTPRRRLQRLAREAAALVAVSAALAEVWVELGAPRERVQVIHNGVDFQHFRPLPRAAARARLGLPPGPWVLTVGELIPRKGIDLLVRALVELSGFRLAVVGEGPGRAALERLARELGVAARVVFAGARPPQELPWWYAAADVFALASRREGLPNVVLEALACGRPVVASRVWGLPEAVAEPVAGRLIADPTPAAFAHAIRELAARPPAPAAVRATVRTFSWEATVRRLAALFATLTQEGGG